MLQREAEKALVLEDLQDLDQGGFADRFEDREEFDEVRERHRGYRFAEVPRLGRLHQPSRLLPFELRHPRLIHPRPQEPDVFQVLEITKIP